MNRVKYRPHGATLQAFGQSTAAVQIIRGPLGSGKTKGVVFKIIKLIVNQRADADGVRKSRIAAIRNTYPDLQTTTIREFKECVAPAMGQFKNGHPPTFVFDFALPDGTRVEAEVDFLALDRAEDVKKLRGTQYTFAWLNETKELPKAVLDMTLGRIDRFPTPGFSSWVGILGDTNAWDEDHWLQTLNDAADNGELPDYEFFIQPGAVMKVDHNYPGAAVSQNGTYWAVNPNAENLIVLREGYYQRQIAGKKDDWIKVNLANEVGLALDGKPVHPEYMESTHKAREVLKPILGIPIYVGLDFGLTPAAVFWQQAPTGRWHALDEIVFEKGDAKLLADEIKRKVAEIKGEIGVNKKDTESLRFVFRGDPAGDSGAQTDSDTVFKILRANGVPAIPASSNDPTLRRAALNRPLTRMVLGGPGLLISPKCKMLRKGLAGGFQYKRVKVSGDERYKDVPDKNIFSHVCEAAEYGLMDAGENAFVDAENTSVRMPKHPVHPHQGRRQQGSFGGWNPFNV